MHHHSNYLQLSCHQESFPASHVEQLKVFADVLADVFRHVSLERSKVAGGEYTSDLAETRLALNLGIRRCLLECHRQHQDEGAECLIAAI